MVAQYIFSTGSLTSYCTLQQVQALLVGYDLSRIGDDEAVADRIQELLSLTRQAVDQAAGHDFFWHADDQIIIDGSGTDRLSLAAHGVVPLVAVQQIQISDNLVPPTDYVVYEQMAEIRLKPTASIGNYFPAGLQNIALTLDWGYQQVPGEVAMAQAKLTAGQILAEATGPTATAAAVRIGDYQVRFAPEGQYGAVIQQLVQDAQQALRPYRRMGMAAV